MRPQSQITRRRFLSLGIGAAACSLVGGPALAVYASRIEPERLSLTRLDVPLSRLPAALDGLTIAHLSDLHIGKYVPVEHLQQAVTLVNSLQPDIVVVTGDFIYHYIDYIDTAAGALAQLHPRSGCYAVLGNHDIWTAPAHIELVLEAAGVTVLRDEARQLDIGGNRLWLLGIDDRGYSGGRGDTFENFTYHWYDAPSVMQQIVDGIPADEPRLLLVHNPDFTEMLTAGAVDLALCGHTHGGQVRLPLLGAIIIPSCFGNKYSGGLVQNAQTTVYVNRGLGVTPPPLRFLCPPEVTLLRLRCLSCV